jgi:hypothetical protein
MSLIKKKGMVKRLFICHSLVSLLFCLLSFNKVKSQDSIPTNKFNYGLKTIFSLYSIYNTNGQTFNTIDYSLYAQYNNIVGVFVGISSVYGLDYIKANSLYGNMTGFNAGLNFNLLQFKKTNFIDLYISESHFYKSNSLFEKGVYPFLPSKIYAVNVDVLTSAVRYRKAFLKNVVLFEVGVFLSYTYDRYFYTYYAYPYSHSYVSHMHANSNFLSCGGNISLSLNISALYNKTY